MDMLWCEVEGWLKQMSYMESSARVPERFGASEPPTYYVLECSDTTLGVPPPPLSPGAAVKHVVEFRFTIAGDVSTYQNDPVVQASMRTRLAKLLTIPEKDLQLTFMAASVKVLATAQFDGTMGAESTVAFVNTMETATLSQAIGQPVQGIDPAVAAVKTIYGSPAAPPPLYPSDASALATAALAAAALAPSDASALAAALAATSLAASAGSPSALATTALAATATGPTGAASRNACSASATTLVAAAATSAPSYATSSTAPATRASASFTALARTSAFAAAFAAAFAITATVTSAGSAALPTAKPTTAKPTTTYPTATLAATEPSA